MKGLLSISLVLFLSFTSFLFAKKENKFIIATASTGGTYYPVGVGIATISSLKLAKKYKYTFSAITSAGSAENVDMIDKGEAEFAVLQGLFGSMAWQGKGKYEGNKKSNLRSVTMLWQNVEQFIINKKYITNGHGISNVKNLYGKGFSIGGRNSGTRVSNEAILSALGIEHKKMDVQYLGYSPTATALQDNKIGGAGIPSGIPTSAVNTAFAAKGDSLSILEFDSSDVNKISASYPVWTPFVIPAKTYPNQGKDIKTIAQPNFLVVNKDVSEEVVYLLTKTVYENLPFLNTVHSATKVMALEKAIDGLPMPLHKGAYKFYKEKGLEIPSRLAPR